VSVGVRQCPSALKNAEAVRLKAKGFDLAPGANNTMAGMSLNIPAIGWASIGDIVSDPL
jgi:hypothetical protein